MKIKIEKPDLKKLKSYLEQQETMLKLIEGMDSELELTEENIEKAMKAKEFLRTVWSNMSIKIVSTDGTELTTLR